MTRPKASLTDLLETAAGAPRTDRIRYRDPIADFGIEAIARIRDWLTDPELAAFAVRVIARAGALGSASEAAAALSAARPRAREPIRRDIDWALEQLGARRPAADATGPAASPVAIAPPLYDLLVATAGAGRTVTYAEAGAVVGLSMRNPHHRRLLGQQLGAISEYEIDHDRPMLSAVVIHKGERPGSGFFQLGEEIGVKRSFESDANFADEELRRVHDYWAGSASVEASEES